MKSLPLISVRDIIIFPNSQIPLQIGRPFSLASIKEAILNFDGQIVVTTQKYIEMNELPDLQQIFQIGCTCKIINKIEFPDGSMKILVQGEHRFKIDNIQDKNGIRFCKGEVLPDSSMVMSDQVRGQILSKIRTNKMDWPKDILVKVDALETMSNAFYFIMGVGHLLATRHLLKMELSLEQIREGLFIIDTLTEDEKKLINVNLARVQEILEGGARTSLKKIEALLI